MRIILVLLCALCLHCAAPASLILPATGESTSKQERLEKIAGERGTSLAKVQEDDSAFSDDNPPEALWESSQLREKAALQWATHCASCHGVRGRGENVPVLEPAPRAFGGFGIAMGFLMGGNKMRGAIFRKIQDGTNYMPGFKDQLTNEEIWGLVYFIEHL